MADEDEETVLNLHVLGSGATSMAEFAMRADDAIDIPVTIRVYEIQT
jgi:hypothetical protein